MKTSDKHLALKITISAISIVFILVRLLFPNLQVDAITLGLLVLAILPWLSPLIKSAEVPGVGKIEFQDVKVAIEKVAKSERLKLGLQTGSRYSLLSDAVRGNPNLSVIGLRIDIENRLRSLAQKNGMVMDKSIAQLADDLKSKGVLNSNAASGLKDLIQAGNEASQGAEVDFGAATWAFEYGPQVIRLLDKKLGVDVGAPGSVSVDQPK
jgi:hypothetical protein